MKGTAYIWATTTSVYRHLKKVTWPEIVVAQGGTSSSKTISILQILIEEAATKKVDITVVGQDLPNLKRGALRDFKRLIGDSQIFRELLSNPKAKEGPYEFKATGSIIEFVSFDSAQDAKNGKRDYLFANEANGIPYEIFFELEQRTKLRTYIDYNPTNTFWAHTEVVPLGRTYSFISTFLHNEYCPEKTKAQIKSYYLKWKQTGSAYWLNKWRVNGLGKTGVVEGLVYPDFTIIEKFPDISQLDYYGYALDWGFANDPMAISRCGNRKGSYKYVGQELMYEVGINAYSLDEIFPTLGITKEDPISADSSNLDAINWLQKKGWNIIAIDKPPGSKKQGIELNNSVGIEIVQGSANFINELGCYMYKNKIGVFDKNVPVDKDDHLLDGMLYWNRWAIHHKGANPKKNKSGRRSGRVYS